jgi:hypothetical protein
VPNSQQRSNEFLGELGKETTLEKELKKIQSEGSKYDKTLEVYGFTLNEAIVLNPKIRPFVDFQIARRGKLSGKRGLCRQLSANEKKSVYSHQRKSNDFRRSGL